VTGPGPPPWGARRPPPHNPRHTQGSSEERLKEELERRRTEKVLGEISGLAARLAGTDGRPPLTEGDGPVKAAAMLAERVASIGVTPHDAVVAIKPLCDLAKDESRRPPARAAACAALESLVARSQAPDLDTAGAANAEGLVATLMSLLDVAEAAETAGETGGAALRVNALAALSACVHAGPGCQEAGPACDALLAVDSKAPARLAGMLKKGAAALVQGADAPPDTDWESGEGGPEAKARTLDLACLSLGRLAVHGGPTARSRLRDLGCLDSAARIVGSRLAPRAPALGEHALRLSGLLFADPVPMAVAPQDAKNHQGFGDEAKATAEAAAAATSPEIEAERTRGRDRLAAWCMGAPAGTPDALPDVIPPTGGPGLRPCIAGVVALCRSPHPGAQRVARETLQQMLSLAGPTQDACEAALQAAGADVRMSREAQDAAKRGAAGGAQDAAEDLN